MYEIFIVILILLLCQVTVFPDGELKVKAVPPKYEEVIRYKPTKKVEPVYEPTGGRSKKLGSQTNLTAALNTLSRDELGKLEKYLEVSTRDKPSVKSSDAPSSSRSVSIPRVPRAE